MIDIAELILTLQALAEKYADDETILDGEEVEVSRVLRIAIDLLQTDEDYNTWYRREVVGMNPDEQF